MAIRTSNRPIRIADSGSCWTTSGGGSTDWIVDPIQSSSPSPFPFLLHLAWICLWSLKCMSYNRCLLHQRITINGLSTILNWAHRMCCDLSIRVIVSSREHVLTLTQTSRSTLPRLWGFFPLGDHYIISIRGYAMPLSKMLRVVASHATRGGVSARPTKIKEVTKVISKLSWRGNGGERRGMEGWTPGWGKSKQRGCRRSGMQGNWT